MGFFPRKEWAINCLPRSPIDTRGRRPQGPAQGPRRPTGAVAGPLPEDAPQPDSMVYNPIDCHALASRTGSWLAEPGPESDVVVSCRVRLARNIEGYPFGPRLGPERAQELCQALRGHLVDAHLDGETWWVAMGEATPVLRGLLRERNLISRDLAPDDEGAAVPGRAVAFGETETTSVMVNEEDHLRIQALSPGFDLSLAWQRAQTIDRYLEDKVELATSPALGYLTSCPTNVGTGLRASVMLHLPALSMSRGELAKVFTAAQRTRLAVRGMQGEGSDPAGHAYQISNQVTLGRTQQQLIDDLEALVPVIIDFERKMRAALLENMEAPLSDRVARSLAALRTSRHISARRALNHLSLVRLGLHLGLVSGPRLELLSQLGLQVQRGHIVALTQAEGLGQHPDPSERDRLRAAYLRRALGQD